MVNEMDHFLQVATRSTRKARRINRIKPPRPARRNLQMRFAVRAGTRASIRSKRHPRSNVGRPRRYVASLLRTGYVRSGTGPELLPTFSTRARTRVGRI
jgi:hypothetical protein